MDVLAQVRAILKEVKPAQDLSGVTDIMEGGYIDSLELINLITMLDSTFGIGICVDDMTPENFNSADAIAALVTRLQK